MEAAILAHLIQIESDVKVRTDESLKRAETMLADVIRQMIPAASAQVNRGPSGVRQIGKKKPESSAPQYEIRQVEAGPLGPHNRTINALLADGWEVTQSVDMNGKSNGIAVWTHTMRRKAVQP
jgi:hypothetical protein